MRSEQAEKRKELRLKKSHGPRPGAGEVEGTSNAATTLFPLQLSQVWEVPKSPLHSLSSLLSPALPSMDLGTTEHFSLALKNV